ncbi:MAG: sugar transferase, partial [Chloroflexi bacterium]|nr:sugar transferase [Chloroflexota bacterium]
GLVLCAPAMLGIILIIKLDSPGPVLFKQPRLGHHRKRFDVFKFRTMHINGSEQGPKPTAYDDQRLTKVGRWLRRTSLDELPQLFNVLRGEMSLVGPRPEQEYLLARYPAGGQRRFEVKPGLTGWWQVNGRLQPMYEHLSYDLYYVDHQSLWLDLKILWLTMGAVLSGEGAI